MLKKETVTSFKKTFDNYFNTNIEMNDAEAFAEDLLKFMSQITKPVPVSDEKIFRSYSLQSRDSVPSNKISI